MILKNRQIVALEAEIATHEEEIERHEERIEQLEKKIERCEDKIDNIQDRCEHNIVAEDGEWVCDRCGMYIADQCTSETSPNQQCVGVELISSGVEHTVCQYCGKVMDEEDDEDEDEDDEDET
jgi:hypothetical protein